MGRIILIILGLYIVYAISQYYWVKHKKNKQIREAKQKRMMRTLKKKTNIPTSEDVDKWYDMSKEDRNARVDKLNKLISKIIVKDPKLTKDLTFIEDCLRKDVLTTNDKKRLNKIWKTSK